MSLPGLKRDAITIYRATAGSDAEGNATDATTIVYTGAGTWGTPKGGDLAIADARGFTQDAVLALDASIPVQLNDRITVRGHTYDVVNVTDARIHNRVALRLVGTA